MKPEPQGNQSYAGKKHKNNALFLLGRGRFTTYAVLILQSIQP